MGSTNSVCDSVKLQDQLETTMSTSNPAPGVGGTAKDGGLSTAASVADGGPSAQQPDNTSQYLPPGGESREKPFTRSEANAQTSNPAPGVGGTAQDGGLSTAATVADGGPNSKEADAVEVSITGQHGSIMCMSNDLMKKFNPTRLSR